MQSLCPSIVPETRPQLVPSPSNSPLSLESWCPSDFEKWLCDSTTTLMRSNFNPSGSNRNPATVNRNSSGNNCVPHIADESMLLSKISTYSNFVHVNIPSPSGSGPLAAESPTLYESANGFVGQPPPSYVRVKREREDEYSCQQITPSVVANIKRELGQGNTRVTVEDFDSTIKDVGNLAIEQVTNDICTACGVLGISSDPNDWSVDDVKAWLLWNVSQYGIKPDFVQKFHMDGVTLGSLSEDYFRQHIPMGGDILYAQLDIWKAAAHLQRSTSSNLESFHLEESMPDMSGILSQWSTPSPSAPGFHRMSPPAGSGGAPVIDLVTGSSPNPTNDFSSEGLQSDDEGSEESFDTEGRCSGGSRPGSHAHIHLWQFLKEILTQPQRYGSCIRWLDRPKGIFKIEDSVHVARLWGKRKNRPAMNYDKLSRSIRQYYKKGIMKKTERSQRLVYQFCHPYGL